MKTIIASSAMDLAEKVRQAEGWAPVGPVRHAGSALEQDVAPAKGVASSREFRLVVGCDWKMLAGMVTSEELLGWKMWYAPSIWKGFVYQWMSRPLVEPAHSIS